MKFNLTIEVEVNEMRFLEALENPEFYAFTTDMETIEDTIKQTVASDISFNNNIRNNGFVTSAIVNVLSKNKRLQDSYHMDCEPVD
tara:strand:- start:333 stop:590 length:258 start_codon:yes stop_codon:yes gene_type:complete